MTATYHYTTVLVEMECGSCGVPFAMSETLYDAARRDHSRNWYCPNGHSRVFVGETDAAKYKRLYKEAEDRVTAVRAERDQAEAGRRAWKGQTTRLKNRASVGQCPFCGQHLRDLERHVNRMHADGANVEPEPEA